MKFSSQDPVGPVPAVFESYSSRNSPKYRFSARFLAVAASPMFAKLPRYKVLPLKVICATQFCRFLSQYTPRTPDVLFFAIVPFFNAVLRSSTQVPSTSVLYSYTGLAWHPQLVVWPDLRLDWLTVVSFPHSQRHFQKWTPFFLPA